MGGKDTGAAAGGFLGAAGMGCGIRPQEESRASPGHGIEQRLLMDIALEDWQTIKVWPDPASEQVVAVVKKMVGGNGGGQPVVLFVDTRQGFGGGDVLQHDAQLWDTAAQGFQHPVDKHRLPVEDVYLGVGDLAVHQ